MPMGKGKTDLDLEWESRTLCSDENCIGVIGENGRCKECGKTFDGEPPAMEEGMSERASVSEPEENEAAISEPHEAAISEGTEDIDSEWKNRRLCGDGNCIGVIGADGRCKECGKAAED